MLRKLRTMEMSSFVMILAVVLSVSKNMLDSSDIFGNLNGFTNLILIVYFFCIAYKMLTQTYTFGMLLVIGVIVIISVYSCFSIKYYSLLYSVMFLVAMQNVNLRQLIKASLITKISLLTVHISVYLIAFQFFPGTINFIYRNGIQRQTFFMNHPNTFTAYLTWTSMELIYLLFQKLKAWHLILIWGINFLFYQFTNSNSGMMILTFTVLCLFVHKYSKEKKYKVISFVSKYGFGIFCFLFYGIAKIYPYLTGVARSTWDLMDKFLTGRLLYGAYALDTVGLTWLGKVTYFPEKSYWQGHWQDAIIFDNLYFQTFFYMGTIFLVLITISFFLIGEQTSYIEKLFISSCIIYGIMENYVINVFIVFPILFIGKYLMNRNISENRKV